MVEIKDVLWIGKNILPDQENWGTLYRYDKRGRQMKGGKGRVDNGYRSIHARYMGGSIHRTAEGTTTFELSEYHTAVAAE